MVPQFSFVCHYTRLCAREAYALQKQMTPLLEQHPKKHTLPRSGCRIKPGQARVDGKRRIPHLFWPIRGEPEGSPSGLTPY